MTGPHLDFKESRYLITYPKLEPYTSVPHKLPIHFVKTSFKELYSSLHNYCLLFDISGKTVKMAPNNLPSIFNATSQDIEMLLAAQCHLGSKNMQTHMEPYLWKTRPDGINVINIGKTW